MKNGVITNSNNNSKFTSNGGGSNPSSSSCIKSPITRTATTTTTKLTTVKTNRTVTWNHDIPAEKLSFTMRREFDRQREETELMSQLGIIIETRLKMTLPEDIASSLTDGVILCHLANYVRSRSVASIHVPSPGVNKLTMARCRRNVDNFLEACRRIGVDEELISCADVVPQCEPHPQQHEQKQQLQLQLQLQQQKQQPQQQLQPRADNDYNADVYVNDNGNDNDQYRNGKVPNPLALLRTVAALIAMDENPHHQYMRYQHQQQELQIKLQQSISSCIQQQEQMLQQQQQLILTLIIMMIMMMTMIMLIILAKIIMIMVMLNVNYMNCHQAGISKANWLGLRQAKQQTYEKIKNNLLSAQFPKYQ